MPTHTTGAVVEMTAENPVALSGDALDLIWKRSVVGNVEPASTAGTSILKHTAINYHSLRPIYHFNQVSKNKQQLNMTRIPNVILQMAYMKLYIPLQCLQPLFCQRSTQMMGSSTIRFLLAMEQANNHGKNLFFLPKTHCEGDTVMKQL